MKTLLICHEDAELDREAITRWLASFSNLVGIIVLREARQDVWRRIKREIKRVGIIRFLDVMAFRIYYKLFLSRKDRIWQHQKIKELQLLYNDFDRDVSKLHTHSPNSREAELFISEFSPDIVLARCKTLLREKIFSIPSKGTLVMHPGICPEYRNAHGCFWALANRDLDKIGMTLLKIDEGIDTGPIYGYYTYEYDEVNESHIVIQYKVVLENLDEIRKKIIEVYNDTTKPLDTSGRESAAWGQPWLTSYLVWKYKARRRKDTGSKHERNFNSLS